MPKSDRDDDAPVAEGAATGKNRAPRPAKDTSDGGDDRLIYRVPEPPSNGSVTVDQRDGAITYTPKLYESD